MVLLSGSKQDYRVCSHVTAKVITSHVLFQTKSAEFSKTEAYNRAKLSGVIYLQGTVKAATEISCAI